MSFNTIRIYDGGKFYDSELPDWHDAAKYLSERDRLDWHLALDRVLDCDHSLLTEEGKVSSALEIRVWSSQMAGYFVLIETPLALIEQVVILNSEDWLPFLSQFLAPIITSSGNRNLFALHEKLANAFIAWAGHTDGSHQNRDNSHRGLDHVDDPDHRRAQQARVTKSQAHPPNESPA
jgi:hypothetical protein